MVGWGLERFFLGLRETQIPNLSTLLSLRPLEKVPFGGGGWCLNPILVFTLSLSQAEQQTTSFRHNDKILKENFTQHQYNAPLKL